MMMVVKKKVHHCSSLILSSVSAVGQTEWKQEEEIGERIRRRGFGLMVQKKWRQEERRKNTRRKYPSDDR